MWGLQPHREILVCPRELLAGCGPCLAVLGQQELVRPWRRKLWVPTVTPSPQGILDKGGTTPTGFPAG